METINNSCKQEIYTIRRHYVKSRGYGSNETLDPCKFTIRSSKVNYIWRESLKIFVKVINIQKKKFIRFSGGYLAYSFKEVKFINKSRYDKNNQRMSLNKLNILNHRKLSSKR